MIVSVLHGAERNTQLLFSLSQQITQNLQLVSMEKQDVDRDRMSWRVRQRQGHAYTELSPAPGERCWGHHTELGGPHYQRVSKSPRHDTTALPSSEEGVFHESDGHQPALRSSRQTRGRSRPRVRSVPCSKRYVHSECTQSQKVLHFKS